MEVLKSRLITFIVLLGLWLILVNPFSVQELYTGIGIALLLVLIPLPGNRIYAEIGITPKRIIFGVIYLFVLIFEIIRANVDVAFRVIQPVIPINPGIVKVKTKLKSRLGRLVLANSITLTPGTITVESRKDEFFVHWIAIDSKDADEATAKIVSNFEKYLEVIFG